MKIWYEDIGDFFNIDRLSEIDISTDKSFIQRLNNLFRVSIYVGLIMILITNSDAWILLPLVTSALVYILYENHINRHNKEGYRSSSSDYITSSEGKRCLRPTKNNPFMNITIDDYYNRPDRPQACPVEEVKDEIDKYMDSMYHELDDVYNRRSADRHFYTMPSTTIPGDQNAFATWLYRIDGETCKEGGEFKCKYYNRNLM